MKDKLIWIKIETKSYYNLLLKLNEIGINLYDNKKMGDYLLLKISYSDYKRIKKYLISYKISLYSETGVAKINQVIQKYVVFLIASIVSIIFLFFVNNIVFKIEVKSANSKIQNLVLKELEKNGLKTLTLKKSHPQIEKIVTKILDDNKDSLEWLEIKYEGLIMIVNVTEKNIPKEEVNYPNCNIIAKSDAKITSLNLYRGVTLKEINDYVTKGEVIISGSITHNEDLKNIVCASGEIYGEVWYKVKVEVPFEETYIAYTGKNRYNLNVEVNDHKYQILRSRIDKKKEEETNLYQLNDFKINLVKEKEFVEKKRILSEEAAYEKGLNLALEKINLKLSENEEILLKKVLKKEVKNSTIYLEVFIVTKENIGVLQVVDGGTSNDNQSHSENF